MKPVTSKLLISLASVVIAVSFFALALLAGAHAVSLAHEPQEELLLLALAIGGATISMINGFGRRTAKTKKEMRRPVEPKDKLARTRSSLIHLGY
jgi:hypothetical protein